jgi:hypothetical protein
VEQLGYCARALIKVGEPFFLVSLMRLSRDALDGGADNLLRNARSPCVKLGGDHVNADGHNQPGSTIDQEVHAKSPATNWNSFKAARALA